MDSGDVRVTETGGLAPVFIEADVCLSRLSRTEAWELPGRDERVA
jgi:hypothetical protein